MGAFVGLFEGDAVGDFVGVLVGNFDGNFVGNLEGKLVGDLVGSFVGAGEIVGGGGSVGLAEGDPVGWGVIPLSVATATVFLKTVSGGVALGI